ncbi:MAG: SLBB domain-containing protein [Burkholderiaceae bacterium]|nr:SLBB domain-containing protein [Burkholderiaceae bacterium]
MSDQTTDCIESARPCQRPCAHRALAALLALAASLVLSAPGHAQTTSADPQSLTSGGPIRLRQPATTAPLPSGVAPALPPLPAKDLPGEFEAFVQRLAFPTEIRRFGAELMTPTDSVETADSLPLVPADYLIKPGDEIVLTIWGSVEADLRLLVDRSGRVSIPRVGPVLVAGVRYADLPATISQRVAQVFRNFQLSVSLGQLRGLRVYVTGFVAKPGSYSVSSLATAIQGLLKAGGPTAAGSFRNIEIRRGNQRMAGLDLYDFLLGGDRSADRMLQADDVIHVGPVGTQVALIGSVNRPAVFELKPLETVADLLRMAGGFTAVADRSRLSIERLDDRATARIVQLALPAGNSAALASGDVLRAFSAVDSALPVQRQNKRVRIEGEVLRPGEYVLPPESSIADALAAAGGLTDKAYPFGTEFNRESVRATQQQNYDRALRDLETDLARSTSAQRTSSADEAAASTARDSSNARLLASLRIQRPSGRVVLQLQPTTRDLPPLALEDGDRLLIPPRPTAVGVFGSVFNAGSYLYSEGRAVEEYLNLAGGPTRGADAGSSFVIRANGSVVSGRQNTGWYSRGTGLAGVKAEAGDTVFVPEEMNKTSFVQSAKDWTQILSQFGLGLAAIKTLGN